MKYIGKTDKRSQTVNAKIFVKNAKKQNRLIISLIINYKAVPYSFIVGIFIVLFRVSYIAQ